MSLTAVEQWSTTAASNTTLGASITLNGTVMTPSQVDDGFRELMAQIATWRTAGTFTGASWTLTYTDAGAAVGPTLTLYRDSASPAASDVIGAISYQGRDSAANAQVYAVDDVVITDPTSTSEDAIRRIRTVVAGTLTTAFQFASTGNVSQYTLVPVTDDGAALGTTALQWSDLFLASGGVVNWNNGDVTLTHAANGLTFAGAANGYLFDAAVAPSTNDGAALGSATVSWSDLFLASGGVINWNNGDVLATHSANLLAFSGASSGYTFDAAISSGAYSSSGASAGWTTGTAAVGTQSSSKTSTAAQTHYQFVNPNGQVGSITTNASATAFNTSSDQRLKENFTDLDASSMIDAIRMYEFSWKADGTRGFGVKAQECFEVFPEAITVGVGEQGDEDYMPWSADYSKFVPLLLAEVKALRARVAALEAA